MFDFNLANVIGFHNKLVKDKIQRQHVKSLVFAALLLNKKQNKNRDTRFV